MCTYNGGTLSCEYKPKATAGQAVRDLARWQQPPRGRWQPCPWCWTSFLLWWWRSEGWAPAIRVQSDTCSASGDELGVGSCNPGRPNPGILSAGVQTVWFPRDELCSLLLLSPTDWEGILSWSTKLRASLCDLCQWPMTLRLLPISGLCTSMESDHGGAQWGPVEPHSAKFMRNVCFCLNTAHFLSDICTT